MDDATLIALKQSIEKWERRAAGEHMLPLGKSNCPLCQLFHGGSCGGCPVSKATGMGYCANTPYQLYVRDRTNFHAKRELDFLRSLLPAEEVEIKKENFNWVNLDYLS